MRAVSGARGGGRGLPLVMALLCSLAGCEGRDGYHRRAGQWFHGDVPVHAEDPSSFRALDALFARDDRRGYYRGAALPESDGRRFRVVSAHEARDEATVWYCDTRRDAAEYWSIQHLRIAVVRDADAPSYEALGSGYARDRRRVYAEGVPFEVRDVASFTPMAGGFARDAHSGYHALVEIPGSHGPSLQTPNPDDPAYVRDRAHAWWGGSVDRRTPEAGPRRLVRRLERADLETLRFPGRGYALDQSRVWYHGLLLPDADAATFAVEESFLGEVDAGDRRGPWSRGMRAEAGPVRATGTGR